MKSKTKAIEKQLRSILSSPLFIKAKKQKKFLEFIVGETLEGRDSTIKAYTIATEVYGRKKSFDPQQDPIIRIEAGRLRRRLNTYYSSEGKDDQIIIDVPKGGYVPHVRDRLVSEKDDRKKSNVSLADCREQIRDDTRARISTFNFTKPIIGVLPFISLGMSTIPTFMLDGFSDEISSGLALFQEIGVIDYYSMAQFRGQTTDIKKIGQQINANYVISGSLIAEGKNIKIRISLSDVTNNLQIWTQVFNRSLSGESLSKTLSEITSQVIGAVASEFGAIFKQRKKLLPIGVQKDLTHYEVIFMHRHAQLTGNWEYGPRIIENLEQILKSDPEFALGWALLGEIHCDRHSHEYSESGESLKKAYSFAKKAVYHDSDCQYGHYVLAYAYMLRGESDKVISASKRVVKLNPNSALTLGGTALWLCIAGIFEKGLDLLQHSIRLNPYYPGWFHHAPFLFHLEQGEYELAKNEAEKFHMPEYFVSYMDKAVAAGLLNEVSEAERLLKKTIDLQPDFANHPRYYVGSFVKDKDIRRKMLKGLNKAGLQAN